MLFCTYNNYRYIFNDFIIPVSSSECPTLGNKWLPYSSGQLKELWARPRTRTLGLSAPFSLVQNGLYIFKEQQQQQHQQKQQKQKSVYDRDLM